MIDVNMTEELVDFILNHAEDIRDEVNGFGELGVDLENVIMALAEESELIELYGNRH